MASWMWPVYKTQGEGPPILIGRVPGPTGPEPCGDVLYVLKRASVLRYAQTESRTFAVEAMGERVGLKFIELAERGHRWWGLECNQPEVLAECQGFQRTSEKE